MIYNVFHDSQLIEKFPTLKEAQCFIKNHASYKKTHYGRRGRATSVNPNPKSNFIITDNMGDFYYIR